VVLMLGTPRARVNGLVFAAVWVLSIFLTGLAVLLLASESGVVDPEDASGVTAWKVVLGVLLIAIGVRQWLKRPREGDEKQQPQWMSTVDRFTASRAAALSFAMSILNPKNLVLVLGAATTIAAAELETVDQALSLAIFTAVASVGIVIPVAAYLLLGDRSTALLARIKEWFTANNAAIMLVVCVVLGVYLIAGA
jgi:threonine/homoserine/homoserine lactone efflux protein